MRWLLAVLGLLALPVAAQPGPPPASGGGGSYTLPAATSSTLGGVMPDGTTISNSAGAISVLYGTTANTAAQGNDSRITAAQTAAQVSAAIAAAAYSLPTATNTVLGGVKPDNVTIGNAAGVLTVTYGTGANTAAQGNDSRITGAYAASNPSGYQTAANVTSSVNTALPSVATTTPLCGTGAAGAAAGCGSSTVLPSGTTATTQTAGDSTTKVATTAFVGGSAPLLASFVTNTQTITLPTNWHTIIFQAIGAAGGSGCGIVQTSGTAASGGGTGGSGARIDGYFLSSVTGGSSLVVTIGAAGLGCVPSGTTTGSTGSTPTAGGNTTLVLGSFSRTAYGGGFGSNGGNNGSSGGGASGGPGGAGGNASGGTGGTPVGAGASTGGSSSTASTPNVNLWEGTGGQGDGVGLAGTNAPASNGPGTGGSGGGLAATPVALAGGSGGRAGPIMTAVAAGGTAGNAGAAAGAVSGSGTDLTGAGGSGGGSSIVGPGGAGGAASGFGASGGGGGACLIGFLAGAPGASTGGAALVMVY